MVVVVSSSGGEGRAAPITAVLHGGDQPHAPAALIPGKETAVPIEEKGGWTAEPVWTLGEGK